MKHFTFLITYIILSFSVFSQNGVGVTTSIHDLYFSPTNVDSVSERNITLHNTVGVSQNVTLSFSGFSAVSSAIPFFLDINQIIIPANDSVSFTIFLGKKLKKN